MKETSGGEAATVRVKTSPATQNRKGASGGEAAGLREVRTALRFAGARGMRELEFSDTRNVCSGSYSVLQRRGIVLHV
jgi:hypothetical protein